MTDTLTALLYDWLLPALSKDDAGNPIAKSENLAKNLERVLGYKKIPHSEAHHIIPKNEPGAARLRALLKKFDIHPDDASNGTFMVNSKTRNQFGENSEWLDGMGPSHQNHGTNSEYIKKLNEDLLGFEDVEVDLESTEDLKNALQQIADKLVRNEYSWP